MLTEINGLSMRADTLMVRGIWTTCVRITVMDSSLRILGAGATRISGGGFAPFDPGTDVGKPDTAARLDGHQQAGIDR
ncbi:MAG TPA: hypothetical protein VFQ95_09720 [Rhodanobacteraceae bacterium]|nr:hypothetical protein [Rhodanobacteraceae bacterium]